MADSSEAIPVRIGPNQLHGFLAAPVPSKGLVIFAHGSGSGRYSPRNNRVARDLEAAGYATLLLDLLTPQEEADRRNVFDIPLLGSRLAEAVDWAATVPAVAKLPIGLFGASTGAGAALLAAAKSDGRIGAIVSRGGRPDLADGALPMVRTPVLLLVGSHDPEVLKLNRWALAHLGGPKRLTVIPGASHLFEEPGTLDAVVREAIRWFDLHLAGRGGARIALPFADRREAGRALGQRLLGFASADPLVLALPRGGVPVAYEVARALDAELDLLLVRKLGAPHHPELGIGAVVDGAEPQVVLNEEIIRRVAPPAGYVHNAMRRELAELERRRRAYLGDRPPPHVDGRTVIVVDDGIATGGTVRAALKGVRKNRPAKLILAVPVAPAESLAELASECDELVCLALPQPFLAVGEHYRDFDQTTDEEVKRLLAARRLPFAAATA